MVTSIVVKSCIKRNCYEILTTENEIQILRDQFDACDPYWNENARKNVLSVAGDSSLELNQFQQMRSRKIKNQKGSYNAINIAKSLHWADDLY